MKNNLLSTLLGSNLRAKLIGWLFFHHDERFFVRQLQAILNEDPANLSRELSRLAVSGLLESKKEGNQKYYQANKQSPIFHELKGLSVKTQGVADIIRGSLEAVSDKITVAFIFGSVASGEHHASSDIDLMIVGQCDEIKLSKGISEAEKKLGRIVNYSLYNPKEFSMRIKKKGEFIDRILNSPKIMLWGNLP